MNQQLYDLGIQSNHITNEKSIKSAIEDIDATFDLVMIAEKMQESLVLLADLLCIPLEDVATLDNSYKSGRVQKLSHNQAWLPDGYSQIFKLYVFSPSGFWTIAPLRYAAKFDPFLSLDCARVEAVGNRDQILSSGNPAIRSKH